MLIPFTQLIASIQSQGEARYGLTISPDWMQGRTTYGGLSAALCLHAALPLAGGMPLRSAQLAFIGPVAGEVSFTASRLRQGKNTALVEASLYGETGEVASRAVFIFGASRQSPHGQPHRLTCPQVTAPEETEFTFPKMMGPSFFNHFDVKLVRGGLPMSGQGGGDNLLWMRHADRAAPNDALSLLALGDAAPPAALSTVTSPARISSMNWSIDVLTDQFVTEEGWWLEHIEAQTLGNGYSSQAMTLWNTSGEPALISRQMVAVF